MKNKYRNPWCKELNAQKPEWYENEAKVVFSYRGVNVLKLADNAFDYVLADCCITQRAGCDKGPKAKSVIDEILDGNQPVCHGVFEHLKSVGYAALSYSQYTADYNAGLRA